MSTRIISSNVWLLAFGASVVVLLSGCATYTTPGSGVNLQAISDYDILRQFETKPAAVFPARMAVVRVQDAGYTSRGNRGVGSGRYCVITTRDIEEAEQFEKLAALPDVAGLATLNRLLVPNRLHSVKDLRVAAAGLHADLLLLYTLDTAFSVHNKNYGPLEVITLGALPDREATVSTTASAVIYDVRTGHIYGLAEATDRTQIAASFWRTEQAIDNTRLETERQAFSKLADSVEETWSGILEEYAGPLDRSKSNTELSSSKG